MQFSYATQENARSSQPNHIDLNDHAQCQCGKKSHIQNTHKYWYIFKRSYSVLNTVPKSPFKKITFG